MSVLHIHSQVMYTLQEVSMHNAEEVEQEDKQVIYFTYTIGSYYSISHTCVTCH